MKIDDFLSNHGIEPLYFWAILCVLVMYFLTKKDRKNYQNLAATEKFLLVTQYIAMVFGILYCLLHLIITKIL